MWWIDNRGEKNPSYKGDAVGYEAVHIWVRKRRPKPDGCEKCGRVVPLDLANRSGKYRRDLDDWDYLCRKCHMDSDGRNDQLRASGKSRRLPNKNCQQCGISFHTDSRNQKFCNRSCWSKSTIGRTVSDETRVRIGKAILGHVVSAETRLKISTTKKNKTL